MHISQYYQKQAKTFSFEFFPPKDLKAETALLQTVTELKAQNPSFVSVTYGAGGSTREKTLEIACRIKTELDIEVMAHLTCMRDSRSQICDILDKLQERGVENILALRGDPSQDVSGGEGGQAFVCSKDGFAHANELIDFIRSNYDFCLGAACYPETHPQAASPDEDIQNLKRKVDAGPSFLITQLFFDNAHYFRFLTRARSVGIDLPIVPGIMPITHIKQIQRIVELSGAEIPAKFLENLEAAKDAADMRKIGVEHALMQCGELLEQGAPGIHFYTLNKSTATREIMDCLDKS